MIIHNCAPYFKSLLFSLVFLLHSGVSCALENMSDEDLELETGQSLFTSQFQTVSGQPGGGSLDFYRIGLDAELSLNANIKSLKLGCGGVNGAGCDIDIDNVSLSGPDTCAGGRPNCDAVMTRPFIEFAVKNPTTLSTREIMGVRFGAESLLGLLTTGTNNGTSNGINALSGYIPIAATTGSTVTAVGNFTNTLEGLMRTVGGCNTGPLRQPTCTGFRTNGGTLIIDSQAVNFNVPAFQINGRRLSSVTVNASSTIASIPITPSSGDLTAKVVAFTATDGTTYNNCLFVIVCGLNLSKVNLNTNLTNIAVDITLAERLGLIHKIPLNNPLSLSLQKENILWPNAPAIAQRGWWMAVTDNVDLGALSTPSGYQVDISSVFGQVASQANTYLSTRANAVAVPFTSAVGALFTGQILLNVPDINLAGNTTFLSLTDLPLGATQNVVPNCYGGYTFC